ncbi:MAG: GNAT family N-acetyltransferase, partial [Actinomycetota bacterium]|nr:GNAT family N-acetyltransferase [Actinomycetota bacterium]
MQPERSQPVNDERHRRAFTMASASPTLRLNEWPYDPTIAMLVQADHTIDINSGELVSLIDRASSMGVRKIRTGALRATSAEQVISHGFHVIDELALLKFDFAAPLPQIRPEVGLRHLRRRHLRKAEAVDLDAFGPKWGQHREALRETQRATLHSRSRRCGDDQAAVIGFALSGYTNNVGYLQRLAVARRHQGYGIGFSLSCDALHWMHQRGCDHALVNTSLQND